MLLHKSTVHTLFGGDVAAFRIDHKRGNALRISGGKVKYRTSFRCPYVSSYWDAIWWKFFKYVITVGCATGYFQQFWCWVFFNADISSAVVTFEKIKGRALPVMFSDSALLFVLTCWTWYYKRDGKKDED